ncbi:GNAT family N-acetyltransferase [Ferruginibacter sp. HRS2-29]|uniref:GNAT family N-acetyltransferase n=1 Tax=Ferruginibacter sp. HRS2-29 TaxID=2487334 RepID=UPI0020CC58FB|nr:GNAT family N-acetyltransferase [Ferruginibacter sp. HRS2-29]MCP9753215.1 GNAT family N-acetyltransferase [Ferruginibacter sp. HRS2-29]
MTVNIRPAIKSDCKKMMQLIHELALYEKAPEQVTVDYDHFVESGFGPNPVWAAYVAETASLSEDNGLEVIGFALYYTRYSTWKGQRLYLEDLLVTECMRGKGIGKLLMDKLIDHAREHHFSGMVWQVLEWNEPAIAFYKRYKADIDAGWLNCSINF